MKRTIGLPGTIATLVGYVVGASIFILPGELAASAGPGVFLAYTLAAVPALLTCLVSAQIGCAFPVSGATYVSVSRLLSPFWGFLLVWVILAAVVVGVALVAYGFADYLAFFLPNTNRTVVAFASVVGFVILNLFGAKTTVRTQGVMVIVFIVALLLFGFGGVAHIDWALMTPLFPNGIGAIGIAAIPAYFSFIGFLVIVDLGGEIKNPQRTIPYALALSFACILILYTIVPLALPGLISWTELGDVAAPVGTAATMFLPSWVANAISLAALLAIVTSLNGIILAQSRDVYALAKDQIFPRMLAHVSLRYQTPTVAILTVGALSLGGVAIGATISQYATLTVLGFMIPQVLTALAVIRLPVQSPERFNSSLFKLGSPARTMVTYGLIAYSLVFMVVAVMQTPRATVVFLGFIALGVAYYRARKRALERSGTMLDDVLRRSLAESEQGD